MIFISRSLSAALLLLDYFENINTIRLFWKHKHQDCSLLCFTLLKFQSYEAYFPYEMLCFIVSQWNILPPQVEGTTDRPRLCVFRSNKHLYVQVIDDTKMHTLASASTMQKFIAEEFNCTSGPTIVSQNYQYKTIFVCRGCYFF